MRILGWYRETWSEFFNTAYLFLRICYVAYIFTGFFGFFYVFIFPYFNGTLTKEYIRLFGFLLIYIFLGLVIVAQELLAIINELLVLNSRTTEVRHDLLNC